MINRVSFITDEYALQQAISVANLLFYGYHVTINDQHIPISSATVRQGIKYTSLDEDSRKIWDDPDMLQAHKYQNIPQIDISSYMGDYEDHRGQTCGPIELLGDVMYIKYVYSANKTSNIVRMNITERSEQLELFTRFMQISHLDKLVQFIKDQEAPIDYESDVQLLVFREDDKTDMLAAGSPFYDVTIDELYKKFISPSEPEIYVPYRQGWSRLLNINPFTMYMEYKEYAVIEDGIECVHLIDVSTISTWDGISTKIENHGIEVEDMKTRPLESFDTFNHKMRKLIGTHEHMRSVAIVPKETSTMKYYVVHVIKGINVNNLEFDMP